MFRFYWYLQRLRIAIGQRIEKQKLTMVIYFLIENWPNLRFICGRRGIGRTRFFNLNGVVGREIMFLCVLRCR